MRKIALLTTLLVLLAAPAQAELDITELVSSDALAYVRLGGLPALTDEIGQAIEQQGIKEIPDAEQMLNQLAPIVPMLIGVNFEDFVSLFGHELALAFYGMDGEQPIVAILTDTRHDPELADEVITELRILGESEAEQLPEPGTYRGVDYEGTVDAETSLRFGFIDSIFVLGFNGGFERIVDRKWGDGEPLHTSEKYQQMMETLDPQGQAWGYADIEMLAPILMANDEEPDPGAQAILGALETVGLKIDLTGHEQMLYLKAHEPDNPLIKLFYRLLFTERPPMLSSSWLADSKGIWVGLNIGDLQQMLELFLSMADKEQGKAINQMLSDVGDLVDYNLRKKFLPLLSGELGIMVNLPEGEFNPQEQPLHLLKLSPVLFLGLNNVSDFTEAMSKITDSLAEAGFANVTVMSTEEYEGHPVHRLVVASDALLPGVAFTPTVTIIPHGNKAGLVALSNHPERIRQLLRMDESEPLEARIAVQASVGEILELIALQQNEDFPESILERVQQITPLRVVLSTDSEELTLSLVSQDSTWIQQLSNGLMAAVLADQLKGETEE